MTRLYLIGGVLAGVLGLCGVIWWQSGRIDRLKTDIATLGLQLGGCTARVNNIMRDMESDNAINNIPDSDLGNVPDGWLLPKAGASRVH